MDRYSSVMENPSPRYLNPLPSQVSPVNGSGSSPFRTTAPSITPLRSVQQVQRQGIASERKSVKSNASHSPSSRKTTKNSERTSTTLQDQSNSPRKSVLYSSNEAITNSTVWNQCLSMVWFS